MANDFTESMKNFFSRDSSWLVAWFFSILLWVIDATSRFDGVDITNFRLFQHIVNNLLAFGGIVALVILWGLISKTLDRRRIVLLLLNSILTILFLISTNGYGSIHVFFNLIIILSLFSKEGTDSILSYHLLLTLLDFLIYPVFSKFMPFLAGIRLIIHPQTFFTLVNGVRAQKNTIANILYFATWVIMAIMIVGMVGGTFYYQDLTKKLGSGAVPQATEAWEKGLLWGQSLLDAMGKSVSNFGELFNPGNYSGVNTGTPEESDNPQGVFLKALNRGDLKYKEESPVYVSAKLEAKTLEKPMNIKVSCNTTIEENDTEIEIKGIVNEDNQATEIEVPVFSGVERNIPCLFEKLPAGDYDIEFKAEFDFAADSTRKIYMMERERMLNDFRVLDDKGQEPTKENILSQIYAIDDTNPDSIYTTGPIELAIGTDKVPWDLAATNNVKPLFGLTIKNIWEDGGKIEKINAIYFKVPQPMSVQKNTCTGIPLDVMTSQDVQEKEGGYTVYKLDPKIEDIKDEATIGCYLVVDNSALDPAPVTTRYLKAHADYTYTLSKKITIEVEAPLAGTDAAEVAGRT